MSIAIGLQSQNLYELQKYERAETSYEADPAITYNIENSSAYSMHRHPSLVNLLTDSISGYNAIVKALYSKEHHHGDYLHYRGNDISEAGILAGGEMNVKNIGTLYGHAYYSREKIGSMYQNYAVMPEDYAPYFVADSMSLGNTVNEHYLVEGGLSMSHRNWHYGLSMFYEGINGAKTTQARREIYSYWFRIALSAARIMPQWIMSVKVWPEINKQSISASSSVKTFRFMQFYGFGQWNRKESTTGYSYGRDNKILGIGSELLFSSNPERNRPWNLTAAIAYNYRKLQTEETSFKNLYNAKTHHLNHTITLSWQLQSNMGLHMQLTGKEEMLAGEEYVYERQRQDDAQTLYDYVKVGVNQLYNRSNYTENLLIKGIWNATSIHSLSLLAGARTDWHKETYKMPDIKIENHTLTPLGGIGYNLNSGKQLLDIEFIARYRTGLTNRYSFMSLAPTQFETAQAYIPYLLRGEDRWELRASLTYMHQLEHGQMGICINAEYDKRVNAPVVAGWQSGYGPERHSLNLDISLFYMF